MLNLLQILKSNMLIVKLVFVALLMATTSYVTWQLATKQVDEFKLNQANEAIAVQKQILDKYVSDSSLGRMEAIAAGKANYELENRLATLTREHKNAKPLPSDCTIDDDGMQYIESAREAAISTATSQPDTAMQTANQTSN